MRLLAFSAAALLWCTVAFGADKPKISKTEFDHLPSSLFYFDDSPVILSFEAKAGKVYRSDNDGKDWTKIDAELDRPLEIFDHPFDRKTAIILTETKTHWITKNQGKSWTHFKVPEPPSNRYPVLGFNAKKPEYIIYTGMACDGDDLFTMNCAHHSYYTKNSFDDTKVLKKDSHGCMFARSTKIFEGAEDETVLCIVDDEGSHLRTRRRLVVSDDWFSSQKEPKLDGYREVKGVAVLASVQKFLLAAVRSQGTDEMALYVSKDAETWDRAEFPQDGGLKEDAYTVLESTPHSIQVDVLSGRANAVGSLYTSNSNGTYFTLNIRGTNRNANGLVDFEQVSGIEGIVLVNVVDNYEEVEKSVFNVEKKIVSKISFDDGRTFQNLKAPNDKNLHFHSVTDLHNGGRVFSSPAPGLLMAVGNTGKYLEEYKDGDLYVSQDAGLTWKLAQEDAHKFEFGDQGGILVAVYDEGPTKEIKYSLNHGEKWQTMDLPIKIRAQGLTTTPDSTSKKFVLVGSSAEDKGKAVIYSIDFEDVNSRKCKLNKDDPKKGDFEKWYARLDKDGKPDCLMGHKQFYWRRKADAECSIDEVYKDPVPVEEACECTAEDYECDYNFVRKGDEPDGECILAGKPTVPDGKCKRPEDKFMGSSGYRKIPGNTCKGGKIMDEQKEWPCSDAVSKPSSGKIKSTIKEFKTRKAEEYYYLERSETSTGEDETVIMRTEDEEIWITHDQGGEWKQILKDEEIIAIYPHMYFHDVVYFITAKKKMFYTSNRGKSIDSFDLPTNLNKKQLQILNFHPEHKDWLIFTGRKGCTSGGFADECHSVAYYSTNGGANWTQLKDWVRNCAWMRPKNSKAVPDKMIFCEHYGNESNQKDGKFSLITSEDHFETEKEAFKLISGFATQEEFIIVAVQQEKDLVVYASLDGKTFAEAKFPVNFQLKQRQAYTVLESATHAVFLHVTTNPERGREVGTLIKSNSNGTSYVKSLEHVNRNEAGYVDFEKVQGLEGVAVVNVVDNWKEVENGSPKKLRSKITHNDGSLWEFLQAPTKDADGKAYKCDVSNKEKCSLNLHGYTQRADPRDTYSSGSAVGLMIGAGNVGDKLESRVDANTYMTRDGGITWKEIRKGSYTWEYGDQGSIIVLALERKATKEVIYSTDEGETWETFQFSDDSVYIDDIITVPSDTSRKFLLWAHPAEGTATRALAIQLDFTGLTNTQCVLKEHKDDGDFELWSPEHPLQKNGCLFGHKAQYYRKMPKHKCYIGKLIPQPHKIIAENCACDRQDFECDFNYELQRGGTCALISGLTPPDNSKICTENKNAIEYFKPTGYRRVPLSTCEGGRELDKSEPTPCPGKEKDFNKKHGASGLSIFFAVVFAFAAATGLGYYAWNNWSGKFGAIRLGDDRGGSNWAEYPVLVLSAIAAVAMATPGILRAIGSWVGRMVTRERRYTTRSSFARGGPSYAPIHSDVEGELLGDDDDDDDAV